MKLRKRTLPSGNKIYYLYFKIDGKRYVISTKSTLKPEAEKFAKEYRYQFKKKIETGMTLKEFRDEYLRRIDASHTYNSWKTCKSSFGIFMQYFGETTSLHSIDYNQAERFTMDMFKKTKHGASLYYRTMKAAFNRGVDWGFISTNPFTKVKLPKIPEKFPAYLNDTQFEKLLESQNDERLKAIYSFAYGTGFRLGEVLSIEWSDINFETKEILLSIKSAFVPKGKKERVMPMSNNIFELLKQLHDSKLGNGEKLNGLVFTKPNGQPFLRNHVSKSFKKMVRKSGLDERLHFHSLRHSFCSKLVNKGASIYVIQKLAGHSSVVVTQKYSHVNRDALVGAISLLD